MDLSSFGININFTLLCAIVGAIEFVKKMDYQDKIKKFYWLLAIVFNLVAGVLITDYEELTGSQFYVVVLKILLNFFLYFGVSSLLYQYVLKVIEAVINKLVPPKP